MTIQELSQVYWMRREIDDMRRRIEHLRDMAMSMQHGSGGGGRCCGDGRMEQMLQEVVDLEAEMASRKTAVVSECRRLEAYIASVPDSYLRQIMRLRFVDGLKWHKVASKLGGTTAEACLMAVRRYLQGC